MALRIVQPSDAYTVDTLVGCIYGPPGLRKSTLAQTAESPLLLDFDKGIHRASFRRAFVPVDSWADVAAMDKSDFEGYSTCIVDTAGRAIDALGRAIVARDPKMANKSGGLSLQGFGALKTEFAMWLRKVRSFGVDVLLVLHSEEQKDGDNTIVRIDAQGGSKQEIYKVSDFMGSISINHEGVITLNLSPSDVAFGKNPANLPVQNFKDITPSSTHMAQIFRQTKERINAMTEEQREVSAALEAWRVKVAAAEDGESLTKLIAAVPADKRIQLHAKRVLVAGARERGFVFDEAKGAFVAKDKPAPGPSESTPVPGTEPPAAAAPASTPAEDPNDKLGDALDERPRNASTAGNEVRQARLVDALRSRR